MMRAAAQSVKKENSIYNIKQLLPNSSTNVGTSDIDEGKPGPLNRNTIDA